MASILIVDDVPAIHIMLKGLIAPQGHVCEGATSGKTGLDKFKKGHFDVILADYSMEPMNGLQFMQKIFQLDSAAVVIVMTGYNNEETCRNIMAGGAFAIVEKPFELKALMQKIEEGIQFRKSKV